jgi:hypothetical protein
VRCEHSDGLPAGLHQCDLPVLEILGRGKGESLPDGRAGHAAERWREAAPGSPHPPAQLMSGTASDINNNSVVLRLRCGRLSLLPAGDVQEEAEELLLLSGQPPDSLVLKVPHGRGDNSLTPTFLEAANPARGDMSWATQVSPRPPQSAQMTSLRQPQASHHMQGSAFPAVGKKWPSSLGGLSLPRRKTQTV